ncbi:MAG: hypothetical protein OEZ37_11050 [Gemmatimonadota bacterium]|nr:hypothetical protein [Gemmatimonadota bacterium]
MIFRARSPGPDGPDGVDAVVARGLRSLDPEEGSPNYWMRFRAEVVRRAGPELARRRLMRQATVPEVMSGWARTLVPAAVLAAALAGLFLARGPVRSPGGTLDLEELLLAEVEGPTIPVFLQAASGDAGTPFFAGEGF